MWIDNLNGDKYRTGKLIPAGLPGAGSADQSAFTTDMDPRGIQPGTAIVNLGEADGPKTNADRNEQFSIAIFGASRTLRGQNSLQLCPTIPQNTVTGYEPVAPTRESRWRLSPTMIEGGFEAWPALDELFPTSYQGVNHNRGLDGGIIGYPGAKSRTALRAYFNADTYDEAVANSRK